MNYPEHEKLSKVKDQSQEIGQFIDWLGKKNMAIGKFFERSGECNSWEVFEPTKIGIEKLLAEYFEINLTVLETEKRLMLDEQRKLNNK